MDWTYDPKKVCQLGHQLLDFLFPVSVQAESTINPKKSQLKPLDLNKVNLIKGKSSCLQSQLTIDNI